MDWVNVGNVNVWSHKVRKSTGADQVPEDMVTWGR